MSIELKVPSFGESITDVVLGQWLRGPGDGVAQDDPVVVIETDKVTAELPAPANGVVTEIIKKEGETALVGEVIGRMEEGEAPSASASAAASAGSASAAGAGAAAAAAVPASSSSGQTGGVGDAVAPGVGTVPDAAGAGAAATTGARGASGTAAGTAATAAPASGVAPRVMPAAARELAQRGLTAEQVTPSGPGGRLLKEDVQQHAAALASAPSAAPSAPAVSGPREEEVVPMTPMRRRIAERLVQSQQQAALLTTFNEVDMGAVIELRKKYKDEFIERHGVKLGFMSFFVKATIEALKQVPELNAEIRDESIVYRNYFDIGVAVGGGKGLVVPVLRSAERMSFAGVELTIADFAQRAQAGKLTLDELQGGTFTISNGGVYGSLLSTPIVNPPQSGVLGMHAIQQRPAVVDGELTVRPMMYIALTYDHRLVDGREAVGFLLRIKHCIENPARILLEV